MKTFILTMRHMDQSKTILVVLADDKNNALDLVTSSVKHGRYTRESWSVKEVKDRITDLFALS